MFNVYIDWRLDCELPFYVGKGTDDRVKYWSRNEHHNRVAKKHGMRREVVIVTSSEWVALELEKDMIREHHTFVYDPEYNGVGTNYTIGGEGVVGAPRTEQSLQKQSATMVLRHQDPVFKQKHAAGLARAYAQPGMSEKRSEWTSLACARPEVKQHRSDAQREAWADPERKQKRIAAVRPARQAYNALRRQRRQDLYEKAAQLVALGMPRTAIAEQLGMKLYHAYRATHHRNLRTGD
jgi:hypothetical protein